MVPRCHAMDSIMTSVRDALVQAAFQEAERGGPEAINS
jgi:hypothetical protein